MVLPLIDENKPKCYLCHELFENMAEALVNTLYVTVRPLILGQQEIDPLCDLIHILRKL